MQIAVLAPDLAEAEWMCQILAPLHHACHPLQSDSALLRLIDQPMYDLLVLAGHEQGNGMNIVREMRHRHASLPILLVTSAGTENDIVAARAAGIDDYLVKPIRPAEFKLRIRVLLKQSHPEQDRVEPVCIGSYLFDRLSLHVGAGDEKIRLTQKEFDLALLFFRHLGRPLSRAFIREAIWAEEAEVPSRTVDTHVSRVRSKLRLHPENGFRLLPVYSFGYRLEKSGNRELPENAASSG
jgi:DNA-binding response OmpR family regulator